MVISKRQQQKLLQLKLGFLFPLQTTNLESTGISQVVVRYLDTHAHTRIHKSTMSMADVLIPCVDGLLLSFISDVDNRCRSSCRSLHAQQRIPIFDKLSTHLLTALHWRMFPTDKGCLGLH